MSLFRASLFALPRRSGLAALAGLLLLAQAANASVEVEVGDGLLISATVGEASVEAAVIALGEAIGAEVVVRGDLGPARQQSFSDVPFEAALRRLAGRNAFMVRYQPREALDEQDRPREIRVYQRGGATDAPRAERSASPTPPVPQATAAVAAALIEKGDATAMRELGRLYGQTPDPATRRQLIAELSQRGNPAAAGLFERALHDSEQPIRIMAGRGLWASRGVDGGRHIREAARREQDPTARQALEQLLKLVERQRPD